MQSTHVNLVFLAQYDKLLLSLLLRLRYLPFLHLSIRRPFRESTPFLTFCDRISSGPGITDLLYNVGIICGAGIICGPVQSP